MLKPEFLGSTGGASALVCILLCTISLSKAYHDDLTDKGLIRVGGYTTLGKNGGGSGFQTSFVDRRCRPFYFSGWNSWEVLETAYGCADALEGQEGVKQGKDLLKWVVGQGQSAGMGVVRFFGHGWSEKMALQNSPGNYNEKALKSLDWVLHEMGQRGLKVVMTFGDNKQEYDSRKLYTSAAGKEPMAFYSDPAIKSWYKDHIKFLVNRKNSVSGILYKDDPAIFAWNLLNEPKCDCNIALGGPYCEVACGDMINDWIWEMADFLKSQDPNHMIVVGEEGFYSQTAEKHWVNPDAFHDTGAPWAKHSGQDFVLNHLSPAIDYLGVHLSIDKWNIPTRWFQKLYLQQHMEDASDLNKPLVVEEFGKLLYEYSERSARNDRDPYFEDIYKVYMQSIQERGPLQGLLFWELDARGATGKNPVPYGIHPEHSVWKDVIHPYTWDALNEVKKRPLETFCVPGDVRSMDAVFYSEFVGGGADMSPNDDDIYYVTHGPQLDTVQLGMKLGEVNNTGSYLTCMKHCEEKRGCIAFRFNAGLEGGSCMMYTHAADEYQWSGQGWQVFYERKAFRNCLDEGCRFCTPQEICIRCFEGDLIWDEDAGRPVCMNTAEPTAENKTRILV